MNNPHIIWNQFKAFLVANLGEDYNNKLVGWEVIELVERYAEEHDEIRVITVEDASYTSSILVLVPHPEHGITVIFIPQHSKTTNQFFLYGRHFRELTKELIEMSEIYKNE